MLAHKAACERWEAGDHSETFEPMIDAKAPVPDGATFTSGMVGPNGEGHKHVSYFGLGVSTIRDEELMRLAQDLDDWIDRARQVLP